MAEGGFRKELVLSIVFLVLGILSFIAVIGYFVLGVPLGLVFFCLAIWNFMMYWQKKKIQMSNALWLVPIPLMGLYGVTMQNLPWGQTGLEIFIFWIVAIWSLYKFFKSSK